jgi:hypothetical protein
MFGSDWLVDIICFFGLKVSSGLSGDAGLAGDAAEDFPPACGEAC